MNVNNNVSTTATFDPANNPGGTPTKPLDPKVAAEIMQMLNGGATVSNSPPPAEPTGSTATSMSGSQMSGSQG